MMTAGNSFDVTTCNDRFRRNRRLGSTLNLGGQSCTHSLVFSVGGSTLYGVLAKR